MGQSKEDMQYSDYGGRPYAKAKSKRTGDIELPSGKSAPKRSKFSEIREGYDALQGLVKSSEAANKARSK